MLMDWLGRTKIDRIRHQVSEKNKLLSKENHGEIVCLSVTSCSVVQKQIKYALRVCHSIRVLDLDFQISIVIDSFVLSSCVLVSQYFSGLLRILRGWKRETNFGGFVKKKKGLSPSRTLGKMTSPGR